MGSKGKRGGGAMATRRAEEIFAHHGQPLGAGRLDDNWDDPILIVNEEDFRGKDGARAVFTQLLDDVPAAEWDLDAVLYLERNAPT